MSADLRSIGLLIDLRVQSGGRAGTTLRLAYRKLRGGVSWPPRLLPTATVWALIDQGVVSLGTFLTSLLIARTLPAADYGAYVLIFGTVVFLNSLQGSLIGFPMSIKGAGANGDRWRHITGSGMALTVGFACISGVVVIGASLSVRGPAIAPWAVAALVLWECQDLLRRALMAHDRHRDAIWGDALSYLGQALALWQLARVEALTPEVAFAVIALTSGISVVLQSMQVGITLPGVSELRLAASDFWMFGRWLALTTFMNVLTVQAFPWTLAYFNGLEAAAQLQAVTNVLGATHPVLFSMSNLIIFAVARARANHGLGAAWRTGSVYSAPAGLLLVPYFTVLLLWPSAVLELFYGANSPYAGLEAMLRIFVVVYSFRYVMYALSAVLRGLEAGRAVFLGELAGAVAALVLGLPLASRGALAAAGGVAISAATQSIATAYLLRRAL